MKKTRESKLNKSTAVVLIAAIASGLVYNIASSVGGGSGAALSIIVAVVAAWTIDLILES